MSLETPSHNEPPRLRTIALTAWAALAIAIVAMSACYAAVGATLGLFFGGIVFAALLTPPLVLAEERWVDQLLIATAICDGIAIVWLITCVEGTITLRQFLGCYILLIAWCCALMGTATLMAQILCRFHLARRVHRGPNGIPIVASAFTIVVALLWLTWPIWFATHLSHANSQFYISWFVPPHPLLAINGILANLGVWSERPIAYAYLMNLGQDVPYILPRSVGPCVVVHLVIGTVGMIVCSTLRSTKQE